MRIYVLFVVALLAAGCDHYRQGPGEMMYLIHEDKPGERIKRGDFLSVHFVHRTEDDSVFASSYEAGHPTYLEQQKSFFKGDIFSGLRYLSEGDSATFKLNFDSMQVILNVPRPPHAKGKFMLFTVKVEKVIPRNGLKDSAFADVIRQFLAEEALKSQSQEAVKVAKYVHAHKLSPLYTTSGLGYILTKRGSGPVAAPGDTVLFEHTGKYITGKVFDCSRKEVAVQAGIYDTTRPYTPSKVVAGVAATMPGVDEALLRFPAGTIVTLIMPSSLAYGDKGNSMFPAYTPLVFEVEILQVISAGR